MAILDRRFKTDPETKEKISTGYNGPSPWQVKYRDPAGVQKTKTFAKKADAQKFETSVKDAAYRGEYIAPEGVKEMFGPFYNAWFSSTVNLRDSTKAQHESYAGSLVLPEFANLPLGAIDHERVQEWVARLSDGRFSGKRYRPATVVKAHTILSKVMASAVRKRLIPANPCTLTELPRIEYIEQRFLTPAEVVRLSEAIDPRYRVMVLFAAETGLRSGELYGLRNRRLDLNQRYVEVAEIATEVKGTVNYGLPKTARSYRRVPLGRRLVEELREPVANLGLDDLVFTAPAGGVIRSRLFRKRFWLPAIKKAELEPLRPHDLRHTAVALWIASGASAVEVARRAGHTSTVTVLNRYGHVFPPDSDKVTDAMDALFAAAAPTPTLRVVPPLDDDEDVEETTAVATETDDTAIG